MQRFAALFVFSVFLLGCVTSSGPNPSATMVPTTSISASPTAVPAEPVSTPSATPSVTAYPSEYPTSSPYDAAPRISSSAASPSNPDRNEPFLLEVTAVDDVGLKMISWESSDSLSSQPESNSFDCGLKTTCSASFTFRAATEGDRSIRVYATDSSGQESTRSPFTFNVRPFDYKEPTPTPSVTASPSVAISSPSVTAVESSCTSNEACGYKEICQSGTCVDVDCTNDAQCGYGKECESNECRRCPSGPYGPAC